MQPLRSYQREALAHVEARFAAGQRRLYVELPTGTGKTAVARELACRELAGGGRVLIIVHHRELIRQLVGGFSAVGEVGMMADGRREPDRPITVGGVQTLARPERLSEVLAHGPPSLLVIDETHHAEPHNTYADVAASLQRASPALRTLGLTATPFRMSGSFREFFPTCAFARSITDMQREGWLCPLRFHTVTLAGAELSSLATERGDYASRELARRVVPHTSWIVASTAPHLEERRTLVFAVNVVHAQALADAYAGAGLEAAAVWGSQPSAERDGVLWRWRVGELQVVVNCSVLGEGYDHRELSALVMARPTRSVGFYLQALGRVTRVCNGKPDAVVIDVSGGRDPRQVLLAHLLDAAPLACGDEAASGSSAKGSGRRDFLIDGCPLALVEHEHAYSCGTGRKLYERELAVGVVRDPGGSGLWTPLAFTLAGYPRCWRLTVGTEPVPLIDALSVIAPSVSRVSDRRAPWRESAPSERALDFLARLDCEAAREAQGESWDAGRVSEAIHRARAARPLQCIRAEFGAARIPPPATLALLDEGA